MEINKIKSDMLVIYKAYLVNKDDKIMREEAAKLYNAYMNVNPLLEPAVAQVLNSLVDIAFDTGVTLSEDKVKKYIKALS